jgi:cytochrome c biogenesis protein CcmG, thiol:disulfide interchange protein DsbE
MKRWIAFSPLLVLVALGAMFLFFSLHRDPQVEPEKMVGKPVPALTLARLDTGERVPLASTLQGPTLVNIWASWCAPCQEEAPALMQLKTQGVHIVGIDYEDDPPRGSADAARAFLDRFGNPFAHVLADPDGRAGIEFGATGVPETYLVGADGVILAKHTGALTPEAAQAMLAKAR